MAHVISSECISCGVCTASCPTGAIEMGAEHYEINPDTCIDCGICVAECPVSAINPA